MRTVLATLGLGFLGAALTGGIGTAAAPLAAGLAGGVAGNLATDLFKHLDRTVCERFLDGWSGIDENHHVVAALRLAQIDALRALLTRFESSFGYDDDRLGEQAGFAFADRVKSFLGEETKLAQTRSFSKGIDDIGPRQAVIALLPDTFDEALAGRRNPRRAEASSTIAQVRAIVEVAVLDELRTRCGDLSKCIPSAFEELFRGAHESPGWFDLFVRDAAEKLTRPDSEFSVIWSAEQTSFIKSFVTSIDEKIDVTSELISQLSDRISIGIDAALHLSVELEDINASIEKVNYSIDSIKSQLTDSFDELFKKLSGGERQRNQAAELRGVIAEVLKTLLDDKPEDIQLLRAIQDGDIRAIRTYATKRAEKSVKSTGTNDASAQKFAEAAWLAYLEEYSSGDFVVSRRLFEKAVHAAPNNGIFLSLLGHTHSRNRPDEAIAIYKKAVELGRRTGDLRLIYESYAHLGWVYATRYPPSAASSNENYRESIRFAMKVQDDDAQGTIAMNYSNIGNNFRIMHKFGNAIKSYEKSKKSIIH